MSSQRGFVLGFSLLLSVAGVSLSLAIAIDELPVVVGAIFGRHTGSMVDANHDTILSAADLTGLLRLHLSTATPTPNPTQTASPSETATATATATMALPTATPTPEGVLFAGDVDELFPHGLADTWTFRVNDTAKPDVTSETVTIAAVAGADFDVEIERGAVHEAQEHSAVGSQVVFRSTTDLARQPRTRTRCLPALVRLALPLVAGETTSTTSMCEIRLTSNGAFLGSFELTETMTPLEILPSVTVPAGTYGPVIRLRGTRSLGQESNDILLAPGVGIVRRVVTSNQGVRTSELLDGTVAGESVRR